MIETTAYGIHLPLASGEEFAKLSLRFEIFRQLRLFRKAVFQVKHVLQVLVACFPYIVHLTLRGFFHWKDGTNKRDCAVKALLSLFSTQEISELRLDNPVDGKYSRVPILLDQRKLDKSTQCI